MTDPSHEELASAGLIQSDLPPPSFVDSAWLSDPDLVLNLCDLECRAMSLQARSRVYAFTDPSNVSEIAVADWLAYVSRVGMRPERRRVAEAIAGYADFTTGKNVRPSKARIGKEIGRSRENVTRHIGALVRSGLLVETGKAARGVIVYALALPAAGARSDEQAA